MSSYKNSAGSASSTESAYNAVSEGIADVGSGKKTKGASQKSSRSEAEKMIPLADDDVASMH